MSNMAATKREDTSKFEQQEASGGIVFSQGHHDNADVIPKHEVRNHIDQSTLTHPAVRSLYARIAKLGKESEARQKESEARQQQLEEMKKSVADLEIRVADLTKAMRDASTS